MHEDSDFLRACFGAAFIIAACAIALTRWLSWL